MVGFFKSLNNFTLFVLTGKSLKTALPVALLIGTILSSVNEGQDIIDLKIGFATVVRIFVNYLIPYLVSSYGFFIGTSKKSEKIDKQIS